MSLGEKKKGIIQPTTLIYFIFVLNLYAQIPILDEKNLACTLLVILEK